MRVNSATNDWPQKALSDISLDGISGEGGYSYLVYFDTYLSSFEKLSAFCSSLIVTDSW